MILFLLLVSLGLVVSSSPDPLLTLLELHAGDPDAFDRARECYSHNPLALLSAFENYMHYLDTHPPRQMLQKYLCYVGKEDNLNKCPDLFVDTDPEEKGIFENIEWQ